MMAKKTSGVDKVLWSTPKSKYKAIFTLRRRGYKPQPLRRVFIKEAQWQTETVGHPHNERQSDAGTPPTRFGTSIGNNCRQLFLWLQKGKRHCADAMARCHTLLAKGYSPQWILEGDIKGQYDHISHDWLMWHIPMDKTILGKWLKCGYIFENEVFPTDEGTPQRWYHIANAC